MFYPAGGRQSGAGYIPRNGFGGVAAPKLKKCRVPDTQISSCPEALSRRRKSQKKTEPRSGENPPDGYLRINIRVSGVALYEFAAGADVLTHEHAEDAVGLGGILDVDLL